MDEQSISRAISVPVIDLEKVAIELQRRQKEVQAELAALEEAKRVSWETMNREITY
jgi:hypothetical protein